MPNSSNHAGSKAPASAGFGGGIIISKILIANRGEIAIRVMRTAKAMGIKTVAVFSDADKDGLFVKTADEAICLGGTHASESYLNQDKIIAAAKQTGAQAIHPGYGFLSENAAFSKRCKAEGIIFIGPSAEAITALGSKIGAKDLMKITGVPTVPGYNGADKSIATLKKESAKIGYPVLLKASAGGGGKGMRIVNKVEELEAAVQAATREAEKSFGDGSLLIEKYFPSAKHIEFQIFGDEHGNYTHLFERECSMQRRYQKVIEESPSPSLTPELREKMGKAAVAAAAAVKYTNAGTVEFIFVPGTQINPGSNHPPSGELDGAGTGAYYFLEVNTRLQVEHPVTEETTGLDLVRMQIEVAQGLPLTVSSNNIEHFGHSIQCRVCAEDPENNFFPSTGEIIFWNEPPLNGLRYDSGVVSGSKVDVFYDSLIAKVISTGKDRPEAIQRMLNALDKMSILGITTNKDFLKELLLHPAFVDASFDTKLIEREYAEHKKHPGENALSEICIAAMLCDWHTRRRFDNFSNALNGWRNVYYQPQFYELEFSGEKLKLEYRYLQNNRFDIRLGTKNYAAELAGIQGPRLAVTIENHLQVYHVAIHKSDVYAHHPLAGTFRLKEVPRFVEPGAVLNKGGYSAPMPGEIVKVLVKPGDRVQSGKGLLVMSSMKMETTIEAHSDGEVEEIFVAEKNFVEADTILLRMKAG